MPAMTELPSTLRPMAPAPLAVHSGTQPRMKAKEVIRIGRNRKPRSFERGVDQFLVLLSVPVWRTRR